jgi:Ca-activated chloride channel family protein
MNALSRSTLAVLAVALAAGGCVRQPEQATKEPTAAERPVAAQSIGTSPAAQIMAPADAMSLRGSGYAGHLIQQGPPATYPGVERFPDKEPTGVVRVAEQPVSTFSIDVDTASYAYVRRVLHSGHLPPREAVRVEEMVNYFSYAYPAPESRAEPFRVTTTVVPSPWAAENRLLHVAVRGYDIERAARPRANVVLLIDVSGSMGPQDRLPLLQKAFRLFAEQLRADDRVAIVVYAGHARVVLEPTPGAHKDRILDAIDDLRAGGSTAGADGLQRAYRLAERHFDPEAVNRVILATDGDFNVGISDPRELERFIARKRKTGIYLSIFGVGLGNLNDALMQKLAQAGNGNAAYIDSLLEARRALAEQLGSTMFPIANDVKVQVEFNPAQVSSWRLIGYETRALRREDFNDDRVDAGDVGAGHTITALYEITPVGAESSRVDALRYQREAPRAERPVRADELAFVKLRYKLPGGESSRLMQLPVRAGSVAALGAAAAEVRFAVAVAAFGQRLRGESALDGFGYGAIAELASRARGADADGLRAEFVRLVRMAETLGPVGMR